MSLIGGHFRFVYLLRLLQKLGLFSLQPIEKPGHCAQCRGFLTAGVSYDATEEIRRHDPIIAALRFDGAAGTDDGTKRDDKGGGDVIRRAWHSVCFVEYELSEGLG